jgi:hypothetical protein
MQSEIPATPTGDVNLLLDPAFRRSVAYHEAGHAAIHWFFGTLGDFYGISMVPNGDTWARVTSKGCNWDFRVVVEPLTKVLPRQARVNAARCILFNLAGPWVQNQVEDRDPTWLDVEVDLHWDDGAGYDDDADVCRAIRAAFAAVGEKGSRPWSMLRRVARWVEEALSEPRMWRVVEALATRLQQVDVLGPEEAIGLMEDAYGGHVTPQAYACRKWRRRFRALRRCDDGG